jgi:predicted dehydrogenase
MVRAAIVGIGRFGQTLVNSVQGKSDKITFVAGTTRTLSKAEDFCREKNIDLRANIDALLGDSEIDAVVLATPHSLHEEQIIRVAQAGKHVFVEKPFTLNVKSAKAALEAVEQAGVVLGIDLQRRFHPSIGEIRSRIRDGRLGTIVCCVVEITSPGSLSRAKDSWRSDPGESPVGALTGLGVHAFDGLIDLCGEIDEVYCINTNRAAQVDDTTLLTMTHKNGVVSTCVCSQVSGRTYGVTVYGTNGIAATVRPSLDRFQFSPRPETGSPPSPPEVIDHTGFNPLTAALEAFATAVRGEAPYPIPGDQILHGVAVFEAIVKSAATGQPVKVG